MGVLNQFEREAKKLMRATHVPKGKRRKRVPTNANAAVGLSYEIVPSATDMRGFPGEWTKSLRKKVLRKGLMAAAKTIEREAKRRLQPHDSRRTGTRDQWSKKAQERNAQRQGVRQSIYTKIKDYPKDDRMLAMVGPEYKDAWVAWFLEFGRVWVYWGNKDANAPDEMQPMPFLRPAAESTKDDQQRILLSYVKRNWESS